jgi:Kef-type K+ transport system membrane component KefB
MKHYDVILFFLQVGVMLAVALVCGQVMRKLRQPMVFGELLGGIVLGPTVFGALAPHAHVWLFPTAGASIIGREAVIKIGLLFFMFAAGLEVNLRYLRQRALSVACTGILGIVVPFGLGFGSVLYLPALWGLQAHNQALLLALFVGVALSISALPVIARILMDLGLIKEEMGVIVLAAATMDDLIGWSLFALVLNAFVPGNADSSLWGTLGLVVGFAALLLSLGRLLGQPILQWSQFGLAWPSGLIGVIAVLVLAVAALAEAIGLHAVFGAFLVGVALGQRLEEDNYASRVIHQFALSFFTPLYFVSIGLKADFVAHFDVLFVLVVLCMACVGKIGGAGLGAWLSGMTLREALAVGFGMNARGAMEMILASVALEYRLIDQRIFVALITMALVTSILSGPMLQRLMQKKTASSLAQRVPMSQGSGKGV